MAAQPVMADIAIIGVGAVGGVVAAALLARTEHRVTLCSRSPFDQLVVEVPPDGAPPTLALAGQHAVSVATDPGAVGADVGPARWVILATKAHQTAGAAAWLQGLCTAETTVVVLQNGVEHADRVADLIGPARVLPAIVDCPATRTEPGRITCYRAPSIVMPDTDDGRSLVEILSMAGIAAVVADDFVTPLWRKLCVNVVSGAIPTLCDQSRGVFRRPDIAALTRGLVAECVAVGRAEGAALDDDVPDRVLAGMQAGDPDSLTSMLVDRRAGKALECDARNGAVFRIGARHGIPTPLNRAVNALLSAINTPNPR